MYYDYIFNCPSNTEFDLLPVLAQEVIMSLNSIWPSYPMIGTKEFGGRKLLHVRMSELLTIQQLNDLFSYFSLDWDAVSIRSSESRTVQIGENWTTEYTSYYASDKTLYLPYMEDICIGENIFRPVQISDTIFLSCYAGIEPMVI